MKGEWEVTELYANGGSINQLNNALPHFNNGNGLYKIGFFDDGVAQGEYYTFDTLNYDVIGNWEVRKKKIYMKMDVYIDGEFEYEKSGKKEFTLYSDSNYIELYGLGYVNLLVKIKKL